MNSRAYRKRGHATHSMVKLSVTIFSNPNKLKVQVCVLLFLVTLNFAVYTIACPRALSL